MSAWPTLREWFQFGSTLALELVIIFAVAKLVSLRLRSASWRRALWQMSLLAMLLVVVGELNGVRGWLRLPEKKSSPLVERKVVVTLQDVEPDLEWFRSQLMSETPPLTMTVPKPTPRPSRWQQHAVWPVLLWAAVAALILLRLLIAQAMAIGLRFTSSRVNDVNLVERAHRIHDAIRQRAASVPLAFPPPHRQRDAGGTLRECRPVVLVASTRAVAPFTFGVWRPVIVLPTRFSETFTPEQQDAALAHELAHVAGFDSAWRCFSQFTCALLWWHPLVWLAKRELDHASELVADEASLLLADGPDRLAECLVACAKELRRPALTTWLGMDGGGFRSALGRRVEHLLQLGPHARLSRPVPWYLRLIAPLVCVPLLWAGMATVMKPGQPRGAAWRSSILGSAFAAAAELKGQSTPQDDRRRTEASRLVQDGKLYYETGRLEEARTNLQAALKMEPGNQTASWYLDAIAKVQSPTNSTLRPVSPKRQAIYDKLRSIRLSEWGPLDRVPLGEVIRGLSDEIRRLDPERKGVNFFLTGSAATQSTNEPGQLKDVTVRLGTKLHDQKAEDVLEIVMKIAERRIKYSVEDYGILISPATNGVPPLYTRFFHMDSNDFQRVLQTMPRELTNASSKALPGRGGHGTGTNGISFLTEITPAQTVIPVVQNWFKSLGVELTEPGKAVFFNDKLGSLMVRATLEDLDVIEKAFQPFGIKSGAEVGAGGAVAGGPGNITEEMQIEAAKLVQDGKFFYEAGQLHAARTNLQAALQFNPVNQGAHYYLDLVNARELAVRAKLKDLKMEPMNAWTNQVQDAGDTNLQTRIFKVDPNTLEQGLKSITGFTNQSGGKKPAYNPNDTNSVVQRVMSLLNWSAPGRGVYYNERLGNIMVRATPAELQSVEKLLQFVNMTPPQLTIRFKVFEVAKTNATQSLDWFLGTVLTNPPPRSRADPNAAVPTITGILTDWQFREMVRALEQRGGTDLLSAPELTTMSGRQAQIKVVDIQYVVTDLDIGANPKSKQPEIMPLAEPFELGPTLDVIPYVQTDGYTIQMSVITSLKEFLGYGDPQTVQPAIAGAAQVNGVTSPVPLPQFRLRQVATSAMVWDGQTLMIGAGSARTMQRKPDANGVLTTNYTEKELIYFITPRLIDAAGNPLHADDEFPERHKTVPAQRKAE